MLIRENVCESVACEILANLSRPQCVNVNINISGEYQAEKVVGNKKIQIWNVNT